MNPFVVFKQSFLAAVVFLYQSIAPAVLAVVLLPSFCAVFNQPFEEQYVVLAALVAALTLLLVKTPSDITLRLSSSYWEALRRSVLRWVVVLGILLFIGFATKFSAEYSRRVITSWIAVTPMLAATVSVTLSVWLRRLLVMPENLRTAVIAGGNDTSRRFAKCIKGSPGACMTVCGFFDGRSGQGLGLGDEE